MVSSRDVAVSTFPFSHRWDSMGLILTDALLIRTYPLSEMDKILVAYTRKYGKLRGVVRGARRIRGRFSGRLEPFNWVEMSGFDKENQELIKIDRIDLVRSFSSNLKDYRSFLQLNVIAELLLETVPDREPNEPLFRLLLLVLPEMHDPFRSDLALLYFELWHLKLSGLFPDHISCGDCGVKLLDFPQVYCSSLRNKFTCPRCKHNPCHPLSAQGYYLLRLMLMKSLGEVISEQVASEIKNEELPELIETLLQRNFERSFDSLNLVHKESQLH
jgi:DNA repair protein RecO (recombination protein O)